MLEVLTIAGGVSIILLGGALLVWLNTRRDSCRALEQRVNDIEKDRKQKREQSRDATTRERFAKMDDEELHRVGSTSHYGQQLQRQLQQQQLYAGSLYGQAWGQFCSSSAQDARNLVLKDEEIVKRWTARVEKEIFEKEMELREAQCPIVPPEKKKKE